jgi:hypothetical protein
VLAAGLTLATTAQAQAEPVPAEPFKVANIHFETKASACDMGIQIIFDTDGITAGRRKGRRRSRSKISSKRFPPETTH